MSEIQVRGPLERFRETLGNKRWRMENLYSIRDKDRRLRRLKFNRIQTIIWNETRGQTPIRDLTLKYRQGGVSTFWLIHWLDDTIFTPQTQSGVLAHKVESLHYLMAILKTAHESMPEALRPRLGDDSKTKMSFPDIGSDMICALDIRSTALHNVHASEWALCEDARVRATLGAVGAKGNVSGETTGNGIANDFHDTFKEAKRGDNTYRARFLPWYFQEEYRLPVLSPVNRSPAELEMTARALRDFGETIDDGQILFRRYKQKELKESFPPEFPECESDAFFTTGLTFFNSRKMEKLYDESKEWEKGNGEAGDDYQAQWEKPQPGHVYVAGADVAEGLDRGGAAGTDYSVLAVMCVTCRRQAFRLRGRYPIDVFYRLCDQWGRAYNNAWLAPEANNHGHAVLLGLTQITHYPNLFEQKPDTRVTGDKIKERKLGWNTTNVTRPLMLDQLKLCMEGDGAEDENNFRPEFMVLDRLLIREALTFQNRDGKLEAGPGAHDDGIFAWAIATQLYLKQRRTLDPNTMNGIYVSGQLESA